MKHLPTRWLGVVLVLGSLIGGEVAFGQVVAPVAVGPLASASQDSLHLARATQLWQQGDVRGAVRWLAKIDVRSNATFAQADRAAFLLAVAHLRLGDRAAFLSVAAHGDPASERPCRRWLSYAQLRVTGSLPAGFPEPHDDFWRLPGAVVLTAAHLLASGQAEAASALLADRESGPEFAAVHRYLSTMATSPGGRNAMAAWRDLVTQSPSENAVALPGAQMHALLALAAGDTASAREIATSLEPVEVAGPQARQVAQIAGQLAADATAWDQALAHLDTAAANWDQEAAWLDDLADPAHGAAVWRVWNEAIPRAGEMLLPSDDFTDVLRQMAAVAVDLTREPDLEWTRNQANVAGDLRPAHLAHARTHRPDQEQWRRWDQLQARTNQAEARHGDLARALSDLETERDRRQQYLALGERKATDRTAALAQAVRELDLLLAQMDLALAGLEHTRAEALRLFAARLANLAAELETSLIYVQAVRQFHVLGPEAERADNWPAAVPRPSELLDLEQALADEILAFVALFGARVPELVNRSCAEVWVPRLAADGPALASAMAAAQQRGARLVAALDSTAQTLPIEREIAMTQIALAQQASDVDSLRRAQVQTQAEIIAQVAVRGRAGLDSEREGLDYQRSNVRYWLAVGDTTGTDDAAARARLRQARQVARQSLRADLENYPQGRARAETRYRLADLELLQARDDFRERMAGFLDERPSAGDLQNKDLAPFVEYAPAVALYRDILAEDPDFTHLPAVLFQLGMILGDAGEPESNEVLTALVERYPDSPFNQEAWLRLGDQHFEVREFAASRPCFTAAARGDDPSLRAIALYKLGWAQFEEDQFAAAADAFGRLLDEEAAGDVADTDLTDEAQEYLVHALIRAGGATAFTTHFQRVGERPYEADILLAMGHQFSGVSLYGDAVACDRLWLERFGDQDQAVAVAQRLVTAYQRWHKPEQARQVHLELADRFLPDRAWFEAHPDTQLRAESQDFARQAYRRAAVHHHQQARQSDDPTAWRLALQHYDTFLKYWPGDADASQMQLQAGEAAFRQGLHAVALDHFQVAAAAQTTAADTATVAREAAWQVVAVTDAWYRDSAGDSGDETTAGADSLARRLIAAVDWYQDAYPNEPRLPELMWRQGQVAYAHSWYRDAAVALADLGRRHPHDEKALPAVRMSGDAWYQLEDYLAAGAAYQQTLNLARQLRADTVAVAMAPIIPRCHFQHAQQVAAADTGQGLIAAAPLFADVAARWPDYEHADLALYRAGLGYEAGSNADAAATAWEKLLAQYPASTYARDSALRIASVHEQNEQWSAAAAALERFSERFADDPDAASALLKASDLLATAGDTAGAEALQTVFLSHFATEVETVMAIREERAARALAARLPDQNWDELPDVAPYLELAAAHPKWAAPTILAEVAYLKADQAHARYTAMKLTQPLPDAVKAKQASLENLLEMYGACAQHGVTEYTRAAAFRIGEAITHFGDALLASERPAELQGDDLLAYEEVLDQQSWPFYDRGEAAWTELLKQSLGADEDPGGWLQQTRAELWPRLARRFVHMPEAEYPLVAAVPPPSWPEGAERQN